MKKTRVDNLMEKPLAASQNLMKDYLSDLLTDEVMDQKAAETEKLNKLLQQVTVTEEKPEPAPEVIVSKKSADTKIDTKADIKVKTAEITPVQAPVEPKVEIPQAEVVVKQEPKAQTHVENTSKEYRNASFQAMFFDVAGLTIAVPLVELGGIHNLEKTTSLVGKPEWFAGVMLHREQKINVVDTALWVMPEKCNEQLKESLNYQYVIMLNNSNWGLLAENLVDTVTLEPEDVKWNEGVSKRPWLAGLVKDRMCALLDVDALIQLLNRGINVQQK